MVDSMRALPTRLLSWRTLPPKLPDGEVQLPSTPGAAPTPRELSLVETAAAKIKADEDAVPARRAAIRYLAAMPCPEAEAALIAALRADRSEWVRHDAALALAAYSTSQARDALLLAATGSARDGQPAETSARVKVVAEQALQRLLAKGMPLRHPETLPSPAKTPPRELELTGYTMLPEPAAGPYITEAERRFAETAGTVPPSSTPAIVHPAPPTSRFPSLRLTPIGVLPPTK
jgi:hypothetical protein